MKKAAFRLRPRQPAAGVLPNRRFHDVTLRPVGITQPGRQAIHDSAAQRFVHDALIENPRGEVG
jgi:hypothetical protein